MVLPIVYAAGMLLLRAVPAVASAAAPYAMRALPMLGRGTLWAVKNPVQTALGVGAAHYATDGATTRAALATGEVAVNAVGAVVGKDNVAAAGRTALDGAAKIGIGLTGAGATVVQRYGPEIVSEVTSHVPLGRLGVATTAIREGAQQQANDLTAGGIQVPEALRPSGSFRDKVEERIEDAEDALGGLVSKAELAHWGALAKQDATTNRFIQAGLLLGGLSGAMGGEGAGGKALHASKNALMMAVMFGAIGHFLFGQRSALFEAASNTLSAKFGGAANNNTPQDAAPAPVAQVSRYIPTIAPASAPAPVIAAPRPALMTPALSMG